MRLLLPVGGWPADYTKPRTAGPSDLLQVSPRSMGRHCRMYSVLELGADLGGEIGGRPIDPLAELEIDKPGDPDRRAGFLGGRFDDLADAAFAVDHEDLLQEHDLLVELAQPAFDHLLDDRLRLGVRLRLLAQHRALAVERRRRHRR